MTVTIIAPVSRETYLDRFFHSLEELEYNSKETDLLIYVDGNLGLFQKVRNKTINTKFKDRLCVYRKKGQPSSSSIHRRRQRISDIHNEMKELIVDCDYVFMIEDDTLVPRTALKKLLGHYAAYPHAGFIAGLEIGRWGFNHIGAWRADDIYETNKVTSIPLEEGLKDVDASGFYCTMTKRDTYVNHQFKPFERVLGPDVDFGLTLRQNGHKNYVDNSLRCVHMTKQDDITFNNTSIDQVELERYDKARFGWTQGLKE